MNSKDTLGALLDADKTASALLGDADRLAATQESRIKEKKAALRREYEQRTAQAIAEARRLERARADAEIDRLDSETERRLSDVRTRFEAGKDRYVDRLFAIVTGASDAE